MPRREEVPEKLRRINWQALGVKRVMLFGSVARRGWGRDIDLLIDPARPHQPGAGLGELLLRIALEAEEATGSSVDVVALQEAPCPVILDAWRYGVVVYEEEPGEALTRLMWRLLVCLDYEASARKLGLTRVAARAAARRWGRG